jgi:putative ABC transport system ATP-binding protein
LDEPTNHLDQASIRQLLDNLRSLPERSMLVIISHDPQIERFADRTMRLHDGRVVAKTDFPSAA